MDTNIKIHYELSEKGLEHFTWDFLYDYLKNNGYSTGSEEDTDKLVDELKKRQSGAMDIIFEGLSSPGQPGGVWVNLKGVNKRLPQPGKIIVKTWEGSKNIFHHTGSDMSKINLSDQYDFWLDEKETIDSLRVRQAKELHRYKEALEKIARTSTTKDYCHQLALEALKQKQP